MIKSLKKCFFEPSLHKKGSLWATPKQKNNCFSRNNKSRSSAFRNFLFYENIICFLSKKCHFQLKQLWECLWLWGNCQKIDISGRTGTTRKQSYWRSYILRPGRIPRIAGNVGNRRIGGKFHKSHQILNQIQINMNKLCLGKISRQKSSKNKIFREFRVFEYVLWQKMKTWKCRKSTESFLNQKDTGC